MAVQRNPIAGTPTPNTSTPNSLQRNGFRVATSSKEQIQDGLYWWAGETGGNQVIIYSTKSVQGEAYPLGGSDYTPVAWGSFGSTADAKIIELINGLPGRPANTQYGDMTGAVTWLHDSGLYFVMNQDYPFIKTEDPLVIWDPSVPQCSGFGVWNNEKKTQNLGNPAYINSNNSPSTFKPQDANTLDFLPNGGTAYGTFKANTRTEQAVMVGDYPVNLSSTYNTPGGWVANVVFRHSQVSHTQSPIFSLGNPSTDGFVFYLLQNTPGLPAAKFGFGNFNSGLYEIVNPLTANQWYFLSVVYRASNNSYLVYVDGSEITGGPFNAGSYDWTVTHEVQIGGQTLTAAIEKTSIYLEIGSFVLDNYTAKNDIEYNYDALFGPGINAKY